MSIKALITEYDKRVNPYDFNEWRTVKQNEFFNHKAPKKLLVASRRAGKSYGAATKAIEVCQTNDYAQVLITGLTRVSIRKIWWEPILKKLLREKKIKNKTNESDLEIKFPNGSCITLFGIDAKPADSDKVLGQAYDLVVVDEAAMFMHDLKDIIENKVEPTTMDRDGEIIMISTPSNFCGGFFYDVLHNTDGIYSDWYCQKMTTLDNPYLANKYKKKIQKLIETNANVVDEPFFKIMYLGEYAHDTSAQIYRVTDQNYYDVLPECDFYIVGVDIGYMDSDAIVVVGWQKHTPCLYLVEENEYPKQDITALAEKIRDVEARYEGKIIRRVMDAGALGKKIQEELANRHHLYYEAAEKQRKFEYIQLMNGDFATKKIMIRKDGIFDKDAKLLLWDKTDVTKWKEAGNYHSDVTDAVLYAWRESTSYLEKILVKHSVNDEDWGDRYEEENIKAYEREQAGYTEFDNNDDDNMY